MNRRAAIEALLFASDQPLSVARIAEVLRNVERDEIEHELEAIGETLAADARPVALIQVAGGYQLATKPEFAEVVSRLFRGKRRVRLTRAALEALAIIAYKQPTTRPEIDAIRGVSSGGVIETLLERNLVRIAGRTEGVGRPLLYSTTEEFLQYLGLNHLRDLPSIEELEAMLAAREEEARQEEDAELAAQEEAGADEVPAASLDQRLRERDLLTLVELDQELESRGRRIQEVAAEVARTRREHEVENTANADTGVNSETQAAAESTSPETRVEAAQGPEAGVEPTAAIPPQTNVELAEAAGVESERGST